jgi:hypothetical protein
LTHCSNELLARQTAALVSTKRRMQRDRAARSASEGDSSVTWELQCRLLSFVPGRAIVQRRVYGALCPPRQQAG